MMHSFLLTLLATATLPAPALPPAATRVARAEAVIKIWTDWDEYSRGQTAQAHIRTREDGYVIVLQADVDGRVRVVFPLDPSDDNFVRGGHDIELAGRGGKGSFYVDGPPGMAAVYAAVSPVPFRFTDFVRGDHWDYGSLYDKSLDSDFESGFTAIVDRMSTGHFDYDIARYRVEGQGSTTSAMSGGGPTYVGSPCWVAPYDAFCGGPTYLPGPLYGSSYWGPGFGVGYGGYGWSFGFSFSMPYYGYGYGYGYGYPYYGYGYGYPYYGYGYPGYGYPYYGGGYRYYTPKAGTPGGGAVTGVGYRPRTTTAGTTGGIGIGYKGTYGKPVPTFGAPVGIAHRTPTYGARPNGWTLGRPGATRPTASGDPRRYGGENGGRGSYPQGGRNDPPAARAPRNEPPRYEPEGHNGGPRGQPSGNGRGSPSAPSGGGHGPSAPSGGHAPSHSGGSAPARPSSPPSHGGGGGGGGHRVPGSHR